MNIGSLQCICRYPLKSALGENLEEAEIRESGLVGDRSFVLIGSETGIVVSAKRPKLWRSMLRLAAAAEPDGEGIVVTFPDGQRRTSASANLVPALSEFLQQPVELARRRSDGMRLERARPDEVLAAGLDADVTMDVNAVAAETPGTGFQDLAAIHLICDATLKAIAEASGRQGGEIWRYRPNFVFAMKDSRPFCENDWVGRKMAVGSGQLEIIHPTPRCAIPTLTHGAGDCFRPEILQAINRLNRTNVDGLGLLPCAGAYARVIEAGTVRLGDAVEVR